MPPDRQDALRPVRQRARAQRRGGPEAVARTHRDRARATVFRHGNQRRAYAAQRAGRARRTASRAKDRATLRPDARARFRTDGRCVPAPHQPGSVEPPDAGRGHALHADPVQPRRTRSSDRPAGSRVPRRSDDRARRPPTATCRQHRGSRRHRPQPPRRRGPVQQDEAGVRDSRDSSPAVDQPR